MICFTFIFISGFIITCSLTLANDTANCTWMKLDEGEECCNHDEEESCAEAFISNSSGFMTFCYQPQITDEECNNPPAKLHNFNFDKITCLLDMKEQLGCFWDVADLPKSAEYSADVHHENSQHRLNCFNIVERDALECHGRIDVNFFNEVVVEVNISLSTLLYRIAKTFYVKNIVKLDPPNNIMISNHLKNLQINWTLPEDKMFHIPSSCYKYELKINDEVITLPDGQLSYIKQDVDLMMKYAFQVRVMLAQDCSFAIHWSDWSKTNEVGPFENKYRVNPWVITVIALVLPMLVLAVLLLCKFQRLPTKLFPPIPSPSINEKNLLKRDDYFQDMSSRCVADDSEVVLTVVERY